MALKIMSEGVGIQSTTRILDLDANTVQDWLSQAAEHMEAISHYMIHDLHIPQVQVDELWAILGKRDELSPQKRNTCWVWTAIDPPASCCWIFSLLTAVWNLLKSSFIGCPSF